MRRPGSDDPAVADQWRSAIVDYWGTVEIFCPPAIPEVNPQKWVFRCSDGEVLPWDAEHWLASVESDPRKIWIHAVYLGCFSMRRVVEVLERRYGRDPESYDLRAPGESALAMFTVSEDGVLMPESVVLSSCAWATGLTHCGESPEPRHGLPAAQDRALKMISDELGTLTAAGADGNGTSAAAVPVTAQALRAAVAAVSAQLGVEECLAAEEIRIKSMRVHRQNAGDTAEADFLNSFIATDLALVADQIRTGLYGSALRSYLSEDTTPRRVDIQERPEVALHMARPQSVPLGRWPAAPEQPLALSQQVAVNQILTPESGGQLFAVNGPPGTGKTTMLRDLVAGIVVRRAEQLAALEHPRQAFTGRSRWKIGDRPLTVNHWKPDLVGHEIVVASSNNGAVENVTTEIPGLSAIDKQWAGTVDYFRDLATVVLNSGDPDLSPDKQKPAWALMAGKLGSKANRATFANSLWFPPTKSPDKDESTETARLLEVLATAITEKPEPWSTCVARYRAAVTAAQTGQHARSTVANAQSALDRLNTEVEEAAAAIEDAQSRASSANAMIDALAEPKAQVASKIEKLQQDRDRHLRHRPGLVQLLFSRHRLRAWEAADDELRDHIQCCEKQREQLVEIWQNAVNASEQARYDAHEARRRKTAALDAREKAVQELNKGQQQWGSFVPDENADLATRELSAPWTDPVWNAERSQVFLAALRLHRDFLHHEPRRMRQNLGTAVNILLGTAPRDLSETTALAAWQSLFFVVPVLSTTFASFGRVFSHLGREALGWLFIDEAGQATPQNAVGALWRSRRAVVVGDPLQLEPVITLPFRAQHALLTDHHVDERWLPGRCSVQSLADHGMPMGTYLPGPDGPRWVGAPLRVHRRCAAPMFEVINEAVYGGMMVDGVPDRRCPTMGSGQLPPESTWLDVPSTVNDGNWIPAEGERLTQSLKHLEHHRQDMTKVLVTSPFVDVIGKSRRIARGYPGLRVGTVHTAQGKEADIVILVLGGSAGARSWAAQKPNLMNVAVSRARHRLYVIGDRSSWTALPYFGDLAHTLPIRK